MASTEPGAGPAGEFPRGLRSEERSACYSLFMSQSRSMVLFNRKHLRSGSDVDRASRGNTSSSSPFGGGRNALDTKVVAVGEGPAGRSLLPAILAFFRRPQGARRTSASIWTWAPFQRKATP